MMAGVSTGASVKSKKLQQRNAILRSTGFIEGPACVKGVGGICPTPVTAPSAWPPCDMHMTVSCDSEHV